MKKKKRECDQCGTETECEKHEGSTSANGRYFCVFCMASDPRLPAEHIHKDQMSRMLHILLEKLKK